MSEKEVERELEGLRFYYRLKDDWKEIFKQEYFEKIITVVNKYEDIIDSAPYDQMDFFLFYYDYGYSYQEIAREKKLPIKAVKNLHKQVIQFFAENINN